MLKKKPKQLYFLVDRDEDQPLRTKNVEKRPYSDYTRAAGSRKSGSS